MYLRNLLTYFHETYLNLYLRGGHRQLSSAEAYHSYSLPHDVDIFKVMESMVKVTRQHFLENFLIRWGNTNRWFAFENYLLIAQHSYNLQNLN